MKQSNQDYVLTPNIPSAMFGNLIGFGIIGLIVGSALGFILESLLLGTGIFVVFTAITNIFGYFSLKSTEYRFEPKQMEYREGFLNITQSNVSYNRITDLSLRQSVTQRLFGTGTILVNTAGSDARELRISYIDNSEQEFENIKQITQEI
jgi:uncharacterized membrane protein YdbT with pleckstrin-like domain